MFKKIRAGEIKNKWTPIHFFFPPSAAKGQALNRPKTTLKGCFGQYIQFFPETFRNSFISE